MRRFITKAIWLTVKKVPWKPILIWGPWLFILLLVGFYGIENWRGARAWDKAQQTAKNAKVSLEFQNHLPPLSEDSLDASTLPILDGVKARSFKRRIYNGDKGLSSKKVFRSATTYNNRWKAEPRDIRLWLDPAKGPFTQAEAAAELRKIAKPDLDRLYSLVQQTKGRQISIRPSSQHPTFEEVSAISLMPSLGAWELAAEDTLLSLAEKNDEQAFSNLEFILTLIEKEAYPTLVSWLVTVSGIIVFENVLWETMMSNILTDAQLEALDQRLSSLDLSEIIRQTIEGELAFMLAGFEEAKADRQLWAETVTIWTDFGLFSQIETGWSPVDETLESIDLFLISRMPSGWLDFEKVELTTQLISMRETLLVGGYSALEKHDFSKEPQPFRPNIYVQELIPIVKKAVTKGIEPEIRIRLARIGIALELFKRKQGRYPSSLEEVNQQRKLSLIDSYSGKNFGYRLKEDLTPIIWSVGHNQVNENGLPSQSRKDGDIVWQLTPILGLTESLWKKKLQKH